MLMANVSVLTENMKSASSFVNKTFSDCSDSYKSINVGKCAVLNNFKNSLDKRMVTFENHSNTFTNKLKECAINLEDIDNLIGSNVTNLLASADSFEFDNSFSIDIEGNILEGIDNIIRDGTYSPNLLPKNNSTIAHRGYRQSGIRENTAEAFEAAGKQGFWGCETDVRFDSKGNLVCSHNTVKNGQDPTSFSEYLKICKKYGMTAIIDLKYVNGTGIDETNLSPTILKAIQEQGMMDSCVLQTNNKFDIPVIRQTSSNARIWYLGDVVNDSNIQMVISNKVECVNIYYENNNKYYAQRINRLKENNVDVCMWNVQSESAKNNLLNVGATYVMSDNTLDVTPYQEGEEDFNNLNNNSI